MSGAIIVRVVAFTLPVDAGRSIELSLFSCRPTTVLEWHDNTDYQLRSEKVDYYSGRKV